MCRYTKNASTGVETFAAEVVKGTPTTGTAADPEVTEGDISAGSASAVMPLWRIPLDGITPGAPVRIAPVASTLKTLGDSVSRTPLVREIHFTKLTNDPDFYVSGFVVGKTATVYCRWVNKGTFRSKAWGSTDLASMDVRSDREGFSIFVDNMPVTNLQSRFLYVFGNKLCFRTSTDMDISENAWHIGSVSFSIK